MKMMSYTMMIAGLMAAGLANTARADFSVICGEQRAAGPEHADVAFIDDSASTIKIYAGGKQVPEGEFGIKGLDADRWLVSVDLGKKGVRQYIFRHQESTVQESIVDDKGHEKKVGQPKKCDWKEQDPS